MIIINLKWIIWLTASLIPWRLNKGGFSAEKAIQIF
jgi:hypothetical protein